MAFRVYGFASSLIRAILRQLDLYFGYSVLYPKIPIFPQQL
ncbi:MAG: hypothetical protein ACI9VS_003815, partial [Candidatus Binatia bacterium]